MMLYNLENVTSLVETNRSGQYVARHQGLLLSSVFQPIFDHGVECIGVEALLRLEDEHGQPIPPGEFFTSESISDSIKHTVEHLSRYIHLHNFAQSQYSNLKLFLNVLPDSSHHILSKNQPLLAMDNRLKELNLESTQIVMEVVEYTSSCDITLVKATENLSTRGFLIAVDDFGTHASTEARVQQLKPDILKIDRSLISNYFDGQRDDLLDAVKLARHIGAKLLAEGIETAEHLKQMQLIGVDMFQGFYLAYPEAIVPSNEKSVCY